MIYKAHLQQAGKGCDYTIGCAQKIIDLDSDNWGSAQEELEQIINNEYGGSSEQRLQKATLFEISDHEDVNLEYMYEEELRIKEKDLNSNKTKELNELKRLQTKYPGA